MENIIFHASHAGFTRDTCSIRETVNSRVECSVYAQYFHMKIGLNCGYHMQTEKTIHSHSTVYRASEERENCTSTFNEKTH